MIDVLTQASFLRTSRNFPREVSQLSIEVDRSYIDIARSVNVRTIGFFPLNRSIGTGENWFITQAKRQQGLRQVYRWDDSMYVANVITIPHGINFLSLTNIVRIWGTFFDGTSWRTLPLVSTINVINQIDVKVDKNNIIITRGAGAPLVEQNGLIIVEFLANP